jgi:hypothetical protein
MIEPALPQFGAKASKLARALFGVSQAAAASAPGVTANTVDPISYSNMGYTPGSPYVTDSSTAQVPDGFSTYYFCYLAQPSVISHLDLFNRIPSASWKGCVEARIAPYDVTDDPPVSTDAQTLFVPYFAPDEPNTSTTAVFNNDYMSDYHYGWEARFGAPPGWYGMEPFRNILKYDAKNTATLQETGPSSKGPNAFCPDPLLPLSSNKAAVLAKIDSLSIWEGGGTINSEGLMWGWRTLSPNAPFAMGGPYDKTNKKYIVLMSDGLNSLVANRPNSSTTVLSDYTAYNYLVAGRFGALNFQTAEAFLNERMLTACANAKAKGVGIFTILFRETDQATKDIMQQCASAPGQAIYAADATALGDAFQNIAGQLSKLRLAK